MDNNQLKNSIIDTLQAKPFNRDALMSLLDEHQPDIRCDEFSMKAKHQVQRTFSIFKKGITDTTLSGVFPTSVEGGYTLLPVNKKMKLGRLLLSESGEYTYTLEKGALSAVSRGEAVSINEKIVLSYSKELAIDSVSAMVSAYVSYYCDATDMKKVLDMGCCPNHNNTNAELAASSQDGYPGADKYSSESRPLLNAIMRGEQDVMETLISHSCPCCNGDGARLTENIKGLMWFDFEGKTQ